MWFAHAVGSLPSLSLSLFLCACITTQSWIVVYITDASTVSIERNLLASVVVSRLRLESKEKESVVDLLNEIQSIESLIEAESRSKSLPSILERNAGSRMRGYSLNSDSNSHGQNNFELAPCNELVNNVTENDTRLLLASIVACIMAARGNYRRRYRAGGGVFVRASARSLKLQSVRGMSAHKINHAPSHGESEV